MVRITLGVVSLVLAATALWLWTDNRHLRQELTAARVEVAAAAAAPPAAVSTDAEAAAAGRPRGGAALLGFVGRAFSGSPPSTADAPPPDVETRRERGQQRLRDLLGRAAGETDEQYRARVAPLISLTLNRPRSRVEDKRAEFEAAAELKPEQREELDRAIADARNELVGLASQAVAAGDLTPYKRNTAGVVSFVGGAAGIADGFDARVRQILGDDQQRVLEDIGFDLIEYLGFTTPWENVTPPPPPNPKL